MTNGHSSPIICHVCHEAQVEALPEYSDLRRITSDSKPWSKGGWIGVCRACGCVQKSIDATWLAEIEQIYNEYTIYYQGDGAEQPVFTSGDAMARSDRIVQCLVQDGWLAETGRMLDIGCGNGGFLHAFSQHRNGWTLAGTEINEKYKSVVEQIPGVEQLYTSEPDQVPGSFELITMIHVLEHIPNPENLLSRLLTKLTPNSHLFIEVPTFIRNPFDLLIADHSTHFTPATLAALVQNSGYAIDTIPSDWIPKELSLLASSGHTSTASDSQPDSAYRVAQQSIRWLQEVVTSARQCAEGHLFGLFGTSIAATWLYSEISDCVSFFVDEDPNRVGRTHMERPIYHPRDVAENAAIFIAMPPVQAEQIRLRLLQRRPDLLFCVASDL